MSKLKAIEVKNFMSIADARLEFDDTNIISICGYNDSGKSALTRLLEIMFYNAYSQEQVAYIKDDTNYWACSLEFDDGVEYNRYKYLDGKSEYELKKDGKVLFTNRSADGVIYAMDKIPEQIENYLGVISVKDETLSEKLNVRRNTDKLFLINTTGGENYKMLNTILRSDLLSATSKKLSQDRNTLQSEASVKATLRDALTSELNSLKVCPESALAELEDMTQKLEGINRRLEYLQAIKDEYDKIQEIVIPKELSLIDSSRLAELEALQSLKKNMDLVITPECTIIDVSRLNAIVEIIELNKGTEIKIPVVCEGVSLDRYNDIVGICQAYNDLYSMYMDVGNIEKELKGTKDELESLARQYNFKICQNCGTVVI